MKEKIKAIWKIIRCNGFYVATARHGCIWNSIYEINTRDARAIIGSIERMVENTNESEKFLSDVKNIINQSHE